MFLWIAAPHIVLISTSSTQFTCLEPSGGRAAPLALWEQGPILIWDNILFLWAFIPGPHGDAAEVAELPRSQWEWKPLLLVAWVRACFSNPARQADWEAYSAFLRVSL